MTEDLITEEDEPDGTDVTLTDLLEQVIEKALQTMAGPMIGKVDTYDAAAGRVAITPLIPLSVDGEIVAAPKLPAVPVCWPRSGTHAITFPLAAGALMELVPLGHDHSRWIVAGTSGQQPTDDRRFSLSDLVAIPVAPSPLSAPPDPTSYDSAWGVLFGQWKAGSNAATKAVGLSGDTVDRNIVPPPGDAMTVWMTTVEGVINTVATGTFTPLNNAFSFTSAGTVTATAAKLKAE